MWVAQKNREISYRNACRRSLRKPRVCVDLCLQLPSCTPVVHTMVSAACQGDPGAPGSPGSIPVFYNPLSCHKALNQSWRHPETTLQQVLLTHVALTCPVCISVNPGYNPCCYVYILQQCGLRIINSGFFSLFSAHISERRRRSTFMFGGHRYKENLFGAIWFVWKVALLIMTDSFSQLKWCLWLHCLRKGVTKGAIVSPILRQR